MKISQIAAELGCTIAQDQYEDREAANAYTSDLLSDVMANAHDSDILVTIQAHKNTVAVAVLVGASVILVCNARPIPTDMVEAARAERVGILVTEQDQFTVSGRLFGLFNA